MVLLSLLRSSLYVLDAAIICNGGCNRMQVLLRLLRSSLGKGHPLHSNPSLP